MPRDTCISCCEISCCEISFPPDLHFESVHRARQHSDVIKIMKNTNVIERELRIVGSSGFAKTAESGVTARVEG